MAKELIIHLGLPKTATTSLQRHVFQNNDTLTWNYIGVRQPREENQPKLYAQLVSAISAPDVMFKEQKEDFLSSLEASIGESDIPLFLSDEMFCVDQSVTWQEKLRRLGEIFDGFEVSCLLTTRNPRAGLFSLYVELYYRLRYKYPNFDDFMESNQAMIFNYENLCRQVELNFNGGLKELLFLPFEELCEKDKFFKKLGLFLNTDLKEIYLPNSNQKEKSKSGVVPSPVPLWIYLNYYFQGIKNKNFIVGRIGVKCAALVKWLPLTNSLSCREIPYPDNSKIDAKFRNSNTWLFENFGINYLQ